MDGETASRPRSTAALVAFAAFLLFWFCAFIALGTWQVHRRAWKLDLIARVDRRIHAPPIAPPPPGSAGDNDYLHVRAHGSFLNGSETLTQAVSDAGPGYWVMTPFRTDAGFTVLVNRGFVDDDHAAPGRHAAIAGPTVVTGLVRPSEPGGGFLQKNDPATGGWHSRDVAAIAKARGLGPVAPYFIDVDATPNAGGYPQGGQTIVSFPNNHLVYLVTWYGLALLVAGAGVAVYRTERAARRVA